jgi:hypothetical protein
VDECIKAYSDLSQYVFDFGPVLKGDIPPADHQCRFDYNKLESALKTIVKTKLKDENADIRSIKTKTGVQTFIVNHGTPSYDVATVCTSYDLRRLRTKPNMGSIWQAGRATIAAPELFKFEDSKYPFVGDRAALPGVTYSNPGEISLSEAFSKWTFLKRRFLVSIGTGVPGGERDSSEFFNPSTSFREPPSFASVATTGPTEGLLAAKSIAKFCNTIAHASSLKHSSLFWSSTSSEVRRRQYSYYRFNVEGVTNLEEWNQAEYVEMLTADYMREQRQIWNLNKCVQDLIDPSKSSQLS